MDSPKKRRRKLGHSLSKSCGAKKSQLCESSPSLERRNTDYNVATNSETCPRESLLSSHSFNKNKGIAGLFDTSMDSLPLETNKVESLPLKISSLPGMSPARHLQKQTNDSSVLQPLDPNNVADDEYLPATQPAAAYILSSVVAYVEVRAGGDNRTRLIMRELRNLGATVVETLRKTVTHIVFQDGKLSTYKLAVSRSVHLVSTQWIYDCRKEKRIVPEHSYPPYDLEYYKDPAKHKMIKRVKSFQPDYDMDQEQRLKRIRKRMKPRPAPVATHGYVPIEEEYEIEYDFMRRQIHSKMERHKSPGECRLARGLITIAGPIDPSYNDYIQRPVSPNSSEDDMTPIPLAVKLMRMIQSPQLNPKLQPNEPLNCTFEGDDVEANMSHLFRESSDTDTSDIIPTKKSCEAEFQTTTPECSTAKTVDSTDNADQPPAKLRKTETAKLPALEITAVAVDSLPTTPGPSASQRAVRKLFNAPRQDDSPKLILPSCSDTDSSQSMSKQPVPTQSKRRKQTPKASPVADMEFTLCVGNAILDDPSSMKTKIARKSDRIKSRRSSAYFAPTKSISKVDGNGETSMDVGGLPTIVCTSLNHEEVAVIKRIAKELGGFEVEDTVSRKTTHVVSMNKCTRRTVNILRGIARGCWIVKKMWVLRSLEAGHWIPEDEFEWTAFSPAVQRCRHERMAFSPFYRPDFFKDCGPIFVSKTSKPSRKELYELICLCGGKVTFSSSAAKIIVGESGHSKTTEYVTVLWILDTIQAAVLKPTVEYTF